METTYFWSIGVQDLRHPFDCHPTVHMFRQKEKLIHNNVE